MDPLQFGVRLAAAFLLVSGLRKFQEPEPTCKALKLCGLPSHRPWVWGLAVVEIAVGVATLRAVTPATAFVTGVLYLFFTVFLWRARAKGVSCGCFGPGERPPAAWHIGADLVAAVGCLAAAAAVA